MTEVRLYEPDEPSEQFEDAQNEWLMRQLRALEESVAEIRDRMRWRGEYWDGSEHQRNDVVRVGEFTMIANRATLDNPAPQGLGDQQWITGLGDTPAWNSGNVTANTLLVGFRATLEEDSSDAYFRYRFRVWIPSGTAGMLLSIWSVLEPNSGTPNLISVFPEFVIQPADENAWFVIQAGKSIIAPGDEFDVLAAFSSQSGPIDFDGNWFSRRANGAPVSGEANHQSGSSGTRIHYVDDDGTDRASELQLLDPGDTFSVDGVDYTITDVDQNPSDVHLLHTPTTRPQNGLRNYSFTTYGELPIPYVDNGPAWSSAPRIQGLYSETGYDDIVANDTMYGVDLEVETAIVSPDWDLLAYSGD